jgi:hypothetical protein
MDGLEWNNRNLDLIKVGYERYIEVNMESLIGGI